MEGSESSVTRIGHTIWTVWGYLTGAVGRYLRPEVTNEVNPNSDSKEKDPVIVTVNKSYRELKEDEKESETKTWNQLEKKMRDGADSVVKVQTATVRGEKVSVKGDANGDHDEDSVASQHTCSKTARRIADQEKSAEAVEKKAQKQRYNEVDYHINIKPREILSTDLLKKDHKGSPPFFTNANIDRQEFEVSGCKNSDLNANVSGINQGHRRKSEQERGDGMMVCLVEETMDSEDIEQGLEHEQTNRSDKGNEGNIKEDSVETAIDYANSQDMNEKNLDKQRHQEKKTSEPQMEKDGVSQLINPTSEQKHPLKVHVNKELIYKEEVSTVKAPVTTEIETFNNVETEQGAMGKMHNKHHEEDTACGAEQLYEFTGAEIFDKQEVTESYTCRNHEHIEKQINMQCELMEFVEAQMENAEISKKAAESSSKMGQINVIFADKSLGIDTNLLIVAMESYPLEQHAEGIEIRTTPEGTLKTEVVQLSDAGYISGSRRLVVIKQDIESAIASAKAEDGNQSKTIDNMSKCKQDTKAEVSSENVMKLAMEETNLQQHSTNREEALQEESQCLLEQEPGQEESTNGKINESEFVLPFYEMVRELRGTASNSVGQTDKTVVESTDELSGPSLQKRDKNQCSIESRVGLTATQIVETKTTSTEQKLLLVKHNESTSKPDATELKCHAEYETDDSKIENESSVATTKATSKTCTKAEAPVLYDKSKTQNLSLTLRDQQSSSECMAKEKSVVEGEGESYESKPGSSDPADLPESESLLKALEVCRNSQKHMEEDGTFQTASALPDEIKAMTTLEGLKEVMSGLTKQSKERQSELSLYNVITETKEKIKLLNDMVEHGKDLQVETMDTESEVYGHIEVREMVQNTRGEKEHEEELTAEGKSNMPHMHACVTSERKNDDEENGTDEETVVDINENLQESTKTGLKRGSKKMEREEVNDKPSISESWAMMDLFLKVSSLDCTVQKSKIAVKNPLIRPPKDPRTLINMTSVKPLTPSYPPRSSPLKKSPAGVSIPSKVALGFKLPGLGSGIPALRQTEAGRKMRDWEEAQCATLQKFGTLINTAEDYANQDQINDKLKSPPQRHPGMGSKHMMMELKNKLKKNKNVEE